jgi:hypothetical protein
MNYEVGDLLVGIANFVVTKPQLFMIKKVIEINRSVMNGVHMETVRGYKIANLNNLDFTFVVSQDQMAERFVPVSQEKQCKK